jgi:CubicO group peptidase (beta-lactamase class C family)
LVLSLARGDAVVTTGKPADVGMSADTLRQAVALYEKAVADDEVRVAVLLVARKGKIVLHEALGQRDVAKKLPMQKDTVFHVASNTKPAVAAGVLALAEEGKINLDAEVGKYLPGFNNEKCSQLTVRQLLNHTSGLRIPGLFVVPLGEKPTLVSEANRVGEVGPKEKPGTTYSYSNAGYNTLGAIIETVAEQPLEEFLRARFYNPLGMKDTLHRDRAGFVERRSVVYNRKKGEEWRVVYQPGDKPKVPLVRASGGMLTTAGDYVKFLQMIANGGAYDGKRYLKEETVRQATANQTKHCFTAEEQKTRVLYYGYGWQVNIRGSYGHTGSDGTQAWIDSKNDLIAIIFTQSVGGDNPAQQFLSLVQKAVVK